MWHHAVTYYAVFAQLPYRRVLCITDLMQIKRGACTRALVFAVVFYSLMSNAMLGNASQSYTHSVEEQALSVDPWEVKLRQVSPGPFLGSMQIVSLGDILLYRDCWSQRTIATGALPGGYFMLGSGARPSSGIDWCGSNVEGHLLALAPPEAEVDFIMPSNSPYLALLLPVHYLNLFFDGSRDKKSYMSGLHHFQCNPRLGDRLLARLNRIIDACQANPELQIDPEKQRAAKICVLDDLAEAGFGYAQGQRPIRLSARRQTLKRALEYGESVQEKISVPEFAARLAVSQRSLELAFREFLGVTPRQYLNYRRMHGVHSELRHRPPGARCVTEVANAWGFSELGRFAGEYRHLFGELPGATLRREQPRDSQSLRDLLH
jgi:AraC family ethanolamine operon transcriptional activator